MGIKGTYIWIRVEYIYVCMWFEYDVIKKMTMQIMTNWSKILILSTLFENRVTGQRGWNVSYFTLGIWAGGHYLPNNMTAAI